MRNDLFLAALKNGVCRSSSAVGLEIVRKGDIVIIPKTRTVLRGLSPGNCRQPP
jgi:hypothetical protein